MERAPLAGPFFMVFVSSAVFAEMLLVSNLYCCRLIFYHESKITGLGYALQIFVDEAEVFSRDIEGNGL